MGTMWKTALPNLQFLLFSRTTARQPPSMTTGDGIYPDVGRQTPAGGAHIFLGQPNIFFVTVNAEDAVPWLAHGQFTKRFGSLVGGHGGSEWHNDDVRRSWR